MTDSDTTQTATRRRRAPAATGVTIYGCPAHEAALFTDVACRHGVLATLTDAALTTQTAGLARGTRCVSVDHTARVTRPVLRALRAAGVAYVSTRSIGYDHIDVDYASSVGIGVGNVAYSPDSVADYALMLTLMALRDAKPTVLRTDAHDYTLGARRGRELRDLTVGVVGTGRIGAAVIDRLRGFGGRVLAHDARPKLADVAYVGLDELLERSDVVTLHTPLLPSTRRLLDRGRIARMRCGAVLVNTGRGALVDTDALLDALEAGHLGGAALDVVEGEDGVFYEDRRRVPIDSRALVRLQAMAQVIVTPHTAVYTDHALRDMVEGSILDCLRHG